MVNIVDHQEKLLTIRLLTDNLDVSALIDTGASKSLITKKLAKFLGLDVYPSQHKLDVVGDQSIHVFGSCGLKFEYGGVPFNYQQFIVIDVEKFSNYEIVLGSDFLLHNKLEVNVHERKLTRTFDKNDSFVDIYLDESGDPQDRVVNNLFCCAEEDILVKSNCMTRVNINVPKIHENGQTFLFSDDCMEAGLTNSVHGIDGICTLENKFVLLTSTSGKDVQIRKGQVVGSISSLVETPEEAVADNAIWDDFELRENVKLDFLSLEQQEQVYEMLYKHRKVLSAGDWDIGNASVTEHKIKLYDDTPLYQRPRRFPGPISDEIERQCEELCLMDIIEPSTSPWSSRLVPIRKADGSLRICVDYRGLNKVTIPDKFPMPNLTDSIFGLKGTKYFTSLDLVRGYYQVPMEEKSRAYTAFSTPRNHWQFKRLSFGLCNAPSSFQREIQAVLHSIPSNKVIVYLDDILILGKTFEEHLDLVKRVLTTLENHHIKIKPTKCKWFQSEVDYLGHTVSSSGIKKTKAYIDSIKEYKQPSTIGELREFLGFINFQRKFLPHCSSIQRPLSSQTSGKKKQTLKWTNQMVEAFEKLKYEMAKEVELAFPDYADEANKIELWVDASATGAGAYLAQTQDGEHRVIGFASMGFTKQQMNYSTLERELAALRWGVKTFRPFICGVPFVLYTDHQPLVHLHNMRLVCSRLARTLQELADYNFEIRYVQGAHNNAADALSRMKVPDAAAENYDSSTVGELPDGLMLDGAPAPGGGDSLFLSLHRTLARCNISKLPKDHRLLRECVVDELLSNPHRYQIKLDRNSRKNLKLMRLPGQLPSLELLLVVSFMFRVKVGVYFWRSEPVIYQHSNYDVNVFLQCLSGIHFNPLVEVKGFELPCVNFSSIVTCSSILAQNYENVSSEEISHSDFDDVDAIADMSIVNTFVSCNHNNYAQPQVAIYVGSNKFCSVLDTGSQISLISESVLDAVNRDEVIFPVKAERCCDMVGLTGKRVPLDKTVLMRLTFGKLELDEQFKFFVVPDCTIPYCFLLGIDFIKEFKITINFDALVCKQNDLIVAQMSMPLLHGNSNEHALSLTVDSNVSHRITLNSSSRDLRLEISGRSSTVTGLSLLLSDEDVQSLQSRDFIISKVKDYVNDNVTAKMWDGDCRLFLRHSNSLTVENDILYFSANQLVVVTPHDIVVDLALALHVQFSHVGRDKLQHLLMKLVWHPSKYGIISDVTTTCPQCQILKVNSTVIIPPTLKITTSYPFELLAMDLISFPRTNKGNIGCIVAVDHYSKWVTVVPIKNKTSLTVIAAIRDNILPFLPAIPTIIMSDNGKEFVAHDFEVFLQNMGIKHQLVTPYRPSSNGCVERVNRTIQGLLRNLSHTCVDWDVKLFRAVISYNNTVHSELGVSPSQFLLERVHGGSNLPMIDKSQIKERWRVGHRNFCSYKVDDYVLMKIPVHGRLNIDKLSPKYKGPFRVSKVNSNEVTYQLRDVSDRIIRAHHKDLQPYKQPPQYLASHPWFQKLMSHSVSSFNFQPVISCPNTVASLQISSDESGEDIPVDFSGVESSDESDVERVAAVKQLRTSDDRHSVTDVQQSAVDFCCMCSFELKLEQNILNHSLIHEIVAAACNDPIAIGGFDAILPFEDGFNKCWEFSSSRKTEDNCAEVSNFSISPQATGTAVASRLHHEEIVKFTESACNDLEVNRVATIRDLEEFIDESVKDNDVSVRFSDSMDSDVFRRELIALDGTSPKNSTPIVQASGYATRSKGPVRDIPNVQTKILERKYVH